MKLTNEQIIDVSKYVQDRIIEQINQQDYEPDMKKFQRATTHLVAAGISAMLERLSQLSSD